MSVFPVFDLVRRVAGPDADVSLVVPVGKSEHGFVPSEAQIAEMSGANMGVMVGLGLDTWMESYVKNAATAGDKKPPRLLKVGDRVPTIPVHRFAGAGADTDPGGIVQDAHVWLDPERARFMVKAIAEDIARVDPGHANAFRGRAIDLDRELETLDQELEKTTASWKTRALVSFHDSLGYFADRYKLTIVGVIEPVPGQPPNEKERSATKQSVLRANVRALFSEPQFNAAPAQALAADLKVPVAMVDPLGGGQDTDTYEKLLRTVATTLSPYLN